MTIKSRKKDHVDSAMKSDVEYLVPAGFADVRFVHNPLPEMDFASVDSACSLFGKKLSAPLMITAVTGGYPDAGKINLRLASAAQKEGIAFSLGSQRAMAEHPSLAETYMVRKAAPDIPIIGNIGACQLGTIGVRKVREMLDAVEADALSIHLNPLQEICQPEGDAAFSGVLRQIGIFAKDLGLPLIVKETGAGISADAALSLKSAGVRMIDVSGAGGTSWSKEEYLRSKSEMVFAEWGNPTCECIASCSPIIETIGSGGVRSGLDAAKAIALGASFAGAALPFLRSKDPAGMIRAWKRDLRVAMLLCGSRTVADLKKSKLVITGKTAEGMMRLGINPDGFARRGR